MLNSHSGFQRTGRRVSLIALCLASMVGAASARTIQVPANVASIQGAIDIAVAGDLVLVAPGTYYESIDFNGKAITVASEQGARNTIIDARQMRSVVRFHSAETRSSVLRGFTLQNGNASDYPGDGGGVLVYLASPTIEENVVINNSACSGNGIGLSFSSALVRNNQVRGNHQRGCNGGTVGGGILIGGEGAAEVTDNLIEDNQTDLAGGGIGMNAAGSPTVARNIIRNNRSGTWGGGVATMNDSRPTFANNVVYGNSSATGGGLYLSVPSGSPGGQWVNNTVADNTSTSPGSELYTTGFTNAVVVLNNIFRATSGTAVAACDGSYSPTPPTFTTNDFFSTAGPLATGTCAAVLASGGNISVDPQFPGGRRPTSYRPNAGSAVIDAGTPTSLAGLVDAARRRRVADGNGDGSAVIDLGAYEYSAGP